MRITSTMLQTALSWAIVALTIATIVLAVQSAKINIDLQDTKNKIDYLETQLGYGKQMRMRKAINTLDEIDYRLPTTLLPINYDLQLHPEIDTGNFTGQEKIQISVVQSTAQIILHSHLLTIKNVYVLSDKGNSIGVLNFELDTIREFLVINLEESLAEDSVITLGIIFEGQMLDKIVGLYSSTYLSSNQEQRTIATSKFEPTHARKAFPCFDEPAMKATFEISLVHPTNDGYHALSNMNEESSQLLGKYTEVRFAKSVRMSTYLACFIVSDFEQKSKSVDTQGIGENFDIRLYTTPHQTAKAEFALDTAKAVTEFYIQYFQVAYPLPKLDMAAIPDFASNAMEHWGLVTYRETALLYDENYSSTWNKQRIAAVVAHELAHMWFGNLVTMMWWNDIWLNEGFARYMEYKGVNEVYINWGMTDQFLIHALHSVMKFDSSVASHPIIQSVENPDQITELFDTISYEKGASIIRMLEDVVGATKFEQAVTNYLKAFEYSNAITGDFIAEVEKLNLGFDVTLFMSTWTEQMGLPVVNVKRSSSTAFSITQKRFFSNIENYDNVYDDSKYNYSWTIPLTYYTDSISEIQQLWFEYNINEVTIPVSTNTKWIKLNVHQIGYYRVNYEAAIWQAIISDLSSNPQSFDISDRAHLLNDVFALADASQLTYDIALDATAYLEKESDFVPWYVATAKLQSLRDSLMYSDTYEAYLQYARGLISSMYNQVTWVVDDDDHLKNRLRVSILTAACALGMTDCLEQAAIQFNSWLADSSNKPNPDLREIVYFYGMQHIGKEYHWEQMWEIFLNEQDASEKTKLMYGLSGVKVPWLLYRYIELAVDEANVRRQDYFTCIQNIAANPAGQAVVWDYVREHWSDLVDRFGLNDRYLGRLIPSITERFASEVKLEEMQAFFNKYPDAGAGTASRNQALETVKLNIRWLKENEQQITDWLNKQF